jgi:hypothetical protein
MVARWSHSKCFKSQAHLGGLEVHRCWHIKTIDCRSKTFIGSIHCRSQPGIEAIIGSIQLQ